ncbi:Glycosyltransferase involved in cell wall bisynthesis [Trichlorobacter thiogenes]|uniref:Glycosyltransferase involved in cell wall bisynthesis n=1 Tax=Trichlorobacter thiogenes TaxID=115783 RepID=A0A1T4JWJ0_9BACT|nr:glycosyltransferase [Trichlorobacter thiogenes]SJZ34570.1 Glycosyltransferase involved in cell wall bisynthesis [Trichlorobacter thiogenes]
MDNPLVSIICICKNRKIFIRQCIESVLRQDYTNFEFLIQDGASTDGTTEIIREYQDDRIKLVSEADSGPGEAFVKVIKRIQGSIWGSCLSDEELLPHAISWAVNGFNHHPDAAVIYGDAYVIDEHSAIIQSTRSNTWSLEKYLRCEVVPPFCATFFQSKYFNTIGYDHYNECGEFDIWLRLGGRYKIVYMQEFIANFRRHPGSNTSTVSDFIVNLPGRLEVLDAFLNSEDFRGSKTEAKRQFIAGQYLWMAENFLAIGRCTEAGEMIIAACHFNPPPERLDYFIAKYLETHSEVRVCERDSVINTSILQRMMSIYKKIKS